MATANQEHLSQLRQLAELILAVAGESVTVMKRTAAERALKLKRQDEWSLYLEFLKVMFNLTDRLSALYLPVKAQPQFMDNLEDAVTLQLKNVLEPAFGSGTDQTEIMLTVGAAVAESRQTYEQYQFLVTENSSVKDEMLKDFGGRVADAMGIAGNVAGVLRRNALRERRDSRYQSHFGRRSTPIVAAAEYSTTHDRYNVRATPTERLDLKVRREPKSSW